MAGVPCVGCAVKEARGSVRCAAEEVRRDVSAVVEWYGVTTGPCPSYGHEERAVAGDAVARSFVRDVFPRVL